MSNELEPEEIEYFQELIGILRWATELGRVNILTEVAMLSAYQANPREGHLQQLLHLFAYMKRNQNSHFIFIQYYRLYPMGSLMQILNHSEKTIVMLLMNCRIKCRLHLGNMWMHHTLVTRVIEGHKLDSLSLSIVHQSHGSANDSRQLRQAPSQLSSLL